MKAAVLITKAKMFNASNSTLYYEQAINQLTALADNNVFDVPLRLVGLFAPYGPTVAVNWTRYSRPRYSRTIDERRTTTAHIRLGPRASSRAIIEVA